MSHACLLALRGLERFLISLDSEHGAAGIHQLGEEELTFLVRSDIDHPRTGFDAGLQEKEAGEDLWCQWTGGLAAHVRRCSTN